MLKDKSPQINCLALKRTNLRHFQKDKVGRVKKVRKVKVTDIDMIPYKTIETPNYDKYAIDVEFVVLHYTAGNLERALNLLTDPVKKVSAHLIIDTTGDVIELAPCSEGTAFRAWHAGKSRWFDGNRHWEGFNDFSIGIEIVNLHGNLFEYTLQQYDALVTVLTDLKTLYPTLESAERIIGHEQIAGWRGKADPGCLFDWNKLFSVCYPDQARPRRDCVCPNELKQSLKKFLTFIPDNEEEATKFWHALSDITETTVQLMHKTNYDFQPVHRITTVAAEREIDTHSPD